MMCGGRFHQTSCLDMSQDFCAWLKPALLHILSLSDCVTTVTTMDYYYTTVYCIYTLNVRGYYKITRNQRHVNTNLDQTYI